MADDEHNHSGASPLFDLTEYFTGETQAWGVFEDRFGRVRRRFKVHIHGAWAGDAFVMSEDFLYDDGTTESRVWTLQRAGQGIYTARTLDCIGAARVVCEPSAVVMRYRFNLKLKTRTLAVDFDDRLYRMDERSAINRAVVSKWGFRLGSVTLFFRKDKAAMSRAIAA
jgi:hypothetical protein